MTEIKAKSVSAQLTESNGNDDLKKDVYFQKYKTLKRKFRKLVEENFVLNEQIVKARKKITKLTKERGFLLDKLIEHEDGDSEDSATESSVSERDDSPEYEEPEPKKARTESISSKVVTAEIVSEDKDVGNSKKKPRKKGEDPAPPCQAVSKGRPCKSKAITGLKYCWHHAPLDPESPYIYCQYYDPLKKNSKQCNIPVLKSNPEPYCNYHKELAQKLKQDNKVADGALPIPPSTPTENDSFMDDADQDEDEDNSELTMDESASTVAISASPVASQTPQSISVPVPAITPTHNSNSSSSSSNNSSATSPLVTTTPGTVSTGTNATNHSTSAVLAMAATNIAHTVLPQGPAQMHGNATSTMNNHTAS